MGKKQTGRGLEAASPQIPVTSTYNLLPLLVSAYEKSSPTLEISSLPPNSVPLDGAEAVRHVWV